MDNRSIHVGKAAYRNEPPHSYAASTHSLSTLSDNDIEVEISDDDSPPPYTEAGTSAGAQAEAQGADIPARLPPESAYGISGGFISTSANPNSRESSTISLAPTLSAVPEELCRVILAQAKLPPRPHVLVKGTHNQTKNNKKETVVDFEFQLDLAGTVLAGWEGDNVAPGTWHKTEVIDDCDGVRTFRGGRWKSRNSGKFSWMKRRAVQDVERGRYVDDEEHEAGEDERLVQPEAEIERVADGPRRTYVDLWCQRFCEDPAPVKSFTLTRSLIGFETSVVQNVLTSHIRSLNYQGHITISNSLSHAAVTVYSPHWINSLRNNGFVFWTCIILQLWIITWPIIWLLEHRYEVVRSEWLRWYDVDESSDLGVRRVYARDRDETAIAEFWAPAVKQAAWQRRKGDEIVLERDARRLQGLSDEQLLGRADSAEDRERRERLARGAGNWADSVVGVIRGVSEIGQEWNRAMGWGADS